MAKKTTITTAYAAIVRTTDSTESIQDRVTSHYDSIEDVVEAYEGDSDIEDLVGAVEVYEITYKRLGRYRMKKPAIKIEKLKG